MKTKMLFFIALGCCFFSYTDHGTSEQKQDPRPLNDSEKRFIDSRNHFGFRLLKLARSIFTTN